MAELVVSLQAELDAATIVAMLTDKAGAGVAERYRRDFEELHRRETVRILRVVDGRRNITRRLVRQ